MPVPYETCGVFQRSPSVVRDSLREWVRALCPDCVDDVYPYLGRVMSLPLGDELESDCTGWGARVSSSEPSAPSRRWSRTLRFGVLWCSCAKISSGPIRPRLSC